MRSRSSLQRCSQALSPLCPPQLRQLLWSLLPLHLLLHLLLLHPQLPAPPSQVLSMLAGAFSSPQSYRDGNMPERHRFSDRWCTGICCKRACPPGVCSGCWGRGDWQKT